MHAPDVGRRVLNRQRIIFCSTDYSVYHFNTHIIAMSMVMTTMMMMTTDMWLQRALLWCAFFIIAKWCAIFDKFCITGVHDT